jgi:hypothetical protein
MGRVINEDTTATAAGLLYLLAARQKFTTRRHRTARRNGAPEKEAATPPGLWANQNRGQTPAAARLYCDPALLRAGSYRGWPVIETSRPTRALHRHGGTTRLALDCSGSAATLRGR